MPEIRLRPYEKNVAALVDEDDYQRLKDFVWYGKPGHTRIYATRWVEGPNDIARRQLHQDVLQIHLPKGYVIDHIDRNPLNCRKENLRVCTCQQNCFNQEVRKSKTSSKYKNVLLRKRKCETGRLHKSPWFVRVSRDGIRVESLTFADEYDAWKKSHQMLKKYHGEFANLAPWTGYSQHPYNQWFLKNHTAKGPLTSF